MKIQRITGIASIVCLLVLAIAGANNGVAQKHAAASDSPDLAEIRNYKLTMDKIEKMVAATTAVNKMSAADPALKKRMEDGSSDNQTIGEKARVFDTNFPQVAAVVHSNGLGTREYIVVALAFMSDVMYVGMKKGGMMKEYPPNSITPENAAFVDANYEKLKALGEKITPKDQ